MDGFNDFSTKSVVVKQTTQFEKYELVKLDHFRNISPNRDKHSNI